MNLFLCPHSAHSASFNLNGGPVAEMWPDNGMGDGGAPGSICYATIGPATHLASSGTSGTDECRHMLKMVQSATEVKFWLLRTGMFWLS